MSDFRWSYPSTPSNSQPSVDQRPPDTAYSSFPYQAQDQQAGRGAGETEQEELQAVSSRVLDASLLRGLLEESGEGADLSGLQRLLRENGFHGGAGRAFEPRLKTVPAVQSDEYLGQIRPKPPTAHRSCRAFHGVARYARRPTT